jgi:hypothetical protein
MLLQQAQIVIRAVHDDLVTSQRVEHGLKIDPRERINEFVPGVRADLNQTDFFRVRMQTIRFRVHRDPGGGAQFFKEARELWFRVNHAASIGAADAPCQASAVDLAETFAGPRRKNQFEYLASRCSSPFSSK